MVLCFLENLSCDVVNEPRSRMCTRNRALGHAQPTDQYHSIVVVSQSTFPFPSL